MTLASNVGQLLPLISAVRHFVSAGTPSSATSFYYTIYPAGSNTPLSGGTQLLAGPATASGATAPATPAGGTNYKGLTTSDRLSFNTGNLAAKANLMLPAGVYQVIPLSLLGHQRMMI